MHSVSIDRSRRFFLVLDRGDEIVETLRRFASENGIRGGRFAAIGAVESATIAYWNRETKQYENHDIADQCEVLSLLGDIAIEGSETRIHAHITLGRSDLDAIGGHLMRAVVYPTLEVDLVDYGATLERRKDSQIGLALIV
jgi:predicted DNA-binding protein with PD1-like motif